MRLARLVSRLGVWLVGSSALAIPIAGLVSFFWGVQAGLVSAGCMILVAGSIAALSIFRENIRLVEAATIVDTRLDLQDRVASAIELSSHQRGPFETLAIDDGERVAQEVSISDAIPVQAGRAWWIWPLLGGCAVAVALFVPRLGTPGYESVDPSIAEATRATLASAIEVLEANDTEEAELDPAQEDALKRIRELEQALSAGMTTPEDAATRAASIAQQEADRLEDQANITREQALADTLEQIQPDELNIASELAEALRKNDLQRAQDSLRDLVKQARTKKQQLELAQELQRLAEQIRAQNSNEQSSQSSDPDAQPTTRQKPDIQPEQIPPDQKDPEQSGSTKPPQESDSAASTENPVGADEASRRQSERELQEQQQREQGDKDAQDLADRLDEVADQLKQEESADSNQSDQREQTDSNPESDRFRPQPPQADPEGNQSQSKPDKPGEPNQGESTSESNRNMTPEDPNDSNRRNESDRTENTEDQPSGETGQPSEQKQGESLSEKQDRSQSPNDQSNPDADQQSQPTTEQKSRPDKNAEPQESQPGADRTPSESTNQNRSPEPSPRQGPQQPGSRIAEPGSQDEGDRSSQQSSGNEQKPDQGPADPEGDSRNGSNAIDRALDQLENMSQRKRESLRRKAQSDQLRNQAEKLLEQATPEQRQRLADIANKMRSELQPGKHTTDWNPETELFDARPEDMKPVDAGQTVGEQEPTGEPMRTGRSSHSSPTDFSQVRQAARSAEQAIEGQVIPRRYRDYVRKVYRKFESQAQQREAAPEGEDARPSSREGSDKSGPDR